MSLAIDLKPQVAAVTGAASGIGMGIATELARAGADTAILDINEQGAVDTAAKLSDEFGVRTIGIRADVTDSAGVDAAFDRIVSDLGRLDILVNNAGIAPAYPLVDFPEKDWDLCVAINLKGYFLCARAAARIMIKADRGGNIINISSKSGVRGSSNNSAYNATKFGVIGLAQGWSREFAPHGIRVNSILPGNVLKGSGIWNPEYIEACAKKLGIRPDQVEDYYNKQVPLGRQCDPADVGRMVVFLCSEMASYVTGCSHLVDGGQEMR